jgi:uncharacterized OB-fold protein
MALKKCEHCGNVFWGDPEARFCALCGVVEKAEVKTPELQKESKDRQLQPVPT